jgi:ATP-binding cassette subfamily B protein
VIPVQHRGRASGPRGFLTDEEKANRPTISKALILRILGYLKPYRPQLAAVFLAIVLSSVLGLMPSIIIGRIVDNALVGMDFGLLVKLIGAAFLTLTAAQVIGVLERYVNAWISQRIVFDIKNQMYRHLLNMHHAFFTTEKQGDIFTRMNSDISGVSSVISGTLTNVVSNVVVVASTLVALFSMSWKLAFIGILIIPLMILPTRFAGRSRWKILTASRVKEDEMNQAVNETLSVSGSLLVKLFSRENREYGRFESINGEVTRLSLKEQRAGSWFHVILGMVTQIGPLLIYFAGGYFIIAKMDSALTVGVITAMVALVNRLYRPIESLLNIQVDFTRSLALFTRIFDYLDREISITNRPKTVKPNVDGGDIRFDHVNFSYSPEVDLIRDIHFSVPGGKMYAIVGPSGSGKSTLVNLIPRLYDVLSGSISIAGVDVRDFDLAYLRECIGMVTQDTYLFNGTVKENLLFAKEDATDEELINACRIANIHDFFASQPQGYDTLVGNRGLKLSGGEKQRVSIARVILKDPKILILDEATSSLDSISEFAIQNALESLMKNRTSIVIAHRLSTVLAADMILVLKEGKIVERGKHDELMRHDGVYKELYETQFSKVMEYEANRDLNP